LRVGYRNIDTAAAYANERGVGDAIRRSGIDRDEVFVETKVWISDYGYDETLHAFDKSAGKLGVDHIDLLILHQALPGECGRTLDACRALETLLPDGKVRAIGVSNFMVEHLDRGPEPEDITLQAAAGIATSSNTGWRSASAAKSATGESLVAPNWARVLVATAT